MIAANPRGLGSCPSPEEVRGSSSLDGASGPLEGALVLSADSQEPEGQDLALALLGPRAEVRPEPAD